MNSFHSFRHPRTLLVSLLLATLLPASADTIIWTNVSGGNWNSLLNWSPNQVPVGGDTAVFSTPGTYAVDVTDNESVSNLVLGAAGGTLTLNITGGTFTVNGAGSDSAQSALLITNSTVTGLGGIVVGGPLTWTGGNIQAAVQCNGGSVNVSSSSVVGFGGQLINTGTMTWTPNSGPRTGGSGGTVISNAASGIINVTLNGNNIDSYSYGYTTAFYNAGQINISGAGQTGSLTDPFYNTGTVAISSGTLDLSGGGTESGPFTVASGATLELGGGTFAFNTGAAITGAGSFAVGSAAATLGTNLQLAGDGTFTVNGNGATVLTVGGSLSLGGAWTFSGGTVNLNGSTTITGNAVSISGGTVNFNGSGPWAPGSVSLSSYGTLGGTAPVLDSGPLNWSGGNIEGVLQCDGGSVNVDASSAVGYGGQLINTGAMTWTPNSGPRTGGSGGTVISNAVTGTINITLNGNNIDSYSYGYTTAFYNAGQINISGAGQTGWITDPFYNTGTVAISSGTLDLSGGGTESGPFTVASGATLDLGGGTFAFNTDAAITGAGSFAVGSAAATLGTNLQLAGDGTFTVNGNGATVLTVGGSLGLGGAWTFSGGTVNLNGSTTITDNAVSISGGTVNFNGPGPWAPGSVALSSYGTLGGTATVLDSGPLNWSGGNIEGILQCNGGSVNVSSSSALGFGGQLINTGTMTWTPNSGPRTGGSGGTVISNAASGIINVTLNGNNIDSYSYGYTTAFYNAGQINISGAGQTGSITDPFYNTGTLNIPSGTLSLTGGYTSTGSTLNFVISSTTSFGQLAVSGACELNNTTLGVTADGYAPSAGDSFPLITYGSETGIFSVFNLPPHANWQPNYGNSAFSLNVASLTPPWLTVQVVTPPVQIPNGFTLLMLGPPDYNYAIQGSTDLSTSGWENLATVYMVNSSFYYTDTAAGTTPFRFFRAVQHPPPLVRREPKGVSP